MVESGWMSDSFPLILTSIISPKTKSPEEIGTSFTLSYVGIIQVRFKGCSVLIGTLSLSAPLAIFSCIVIILLRKPRTQQKYCVHVGRHLINILRIVTPNYGLAKRVR